MGALTSDQSDCQEDKGQQQLHGLFSVGDKDSSLVQGSSGTTDSDPGVTCVFCFSLKSP